jgi:hypothetical protein
MVFKKGNKTWNKGLSRELQPFFGKVPWNKGKKMSEEFKDKMKKISNLNQKYLFKKGLIPWNKGKKMPKEFGEALSKIKKGKKINCSTKFKNGHISYYSPKGTHHSEEIRKKMSKSIKKAFLKPEIRKKLSESHIGNKNFFWAGGLSKEPYSLDWTKTLKRSIRERDKYTCQLCKDEGLCIHHIDYDKKNCNSNNLITLCRKCHNKTNFNREYFINLFKSRCTE